MMVNAMPRRIATAFAAILWSMLAGLAPVAVAQVETGVTKPAVVPAPGHGHTAAEDADKIRFHRLRRLAARLAADEEAVKVQRETCRYESSIAVSPPHRRVALTFDDGPEPGLTEYILSVLHKHGVPATFFMIGDKAKRHPELVASVRAEALHHIGNHSWSHPNFHAISVEQQQQEVLDADRELRGDKAINLFRYPYGNSSCETNQLLKAQGYATVGWHVDSCDWAFDRTGTVDAREAMECGVLPQHHSQYVEHILSAVRAHNGGIVLMHEIHAHTIHQLDEVIVRLKAEGFEFGSLDEAAFAASLVR